MLKFPKELDTDERQEFAELEAEETTLWQKVSRHISEKTPVNRTGQRKLPLLIHVDPENQHTIR